MRDRDGKAKSMETPLERRRVAMFLHSRSCTELGGFS